MSLYERDSASASQTNIFFYYSLHNQTLENVQLAKYLGITITDNMDWDQHISEISSKATKTLDFLCRNLAFAPRSTKKGTYKTLVRTKLEYTTPIWSPYTKLQIKQMEKGGGTLIFSSYVGSVPASTAHPQKNIRNFKHPKKIFEILPTPKKYPPFCTLRKDPKMHRNDT